jgi:hypothetical protein
MGSVLDRCKPGLWYGVCPEVGGRGRIFSNGFLSNYLSQPLLIFGIQSHTVGFKFRPVAHQLPVYRLS